MNRLTALWLAGLAACSSQAVAPSGAGLCWRMSEPGGDQATFRVIARDVPNLESCAVQLDGARMIEGQSTQGAYNGYFIFATEDQVTSARTMEATRIRVFEAEDREEIRAGLRALIENDRASTEPTAERAAD